MIGGGIVLGIVGFFLGTICKDSLEKLRKRRIKQDKVGAENEQNVAGIANGDILGVGTSGSNDGGGGGGASNDGSMDDFVADERNGGKGRGDWSMAKESLSIDDSTRWSHSINRRPTIPSVIGPNLASVATASGIRVGFLSDLLYQLWVHLSAAGGKSLVNCVEPLFGEMLPSPLNKLVFAQCDLGSNPIQLDNITVHDISQDKKSLKIDVDFGWIADCDIQLRSPILGTFGIKCFQLVGRLQIILKPLTDTLPCVGAIQYAFINQPTMDVSFSGIAKLAGTTAIKTKLLHFLQNIISGMMVLPNRKILHFNDNNDFLDIYHPPLGVVRLTLISGRGFRIKRGTFYNELPDVYCNIQLGIKTWRTTTQMDCLEPKWDETEACDFLLGDYDQIIRIEVWDEDNAPYDDDDELGGAMITAGEILLANKQTVELPLVTANYKPTGAFITVKCQMSPFTPDIASLFNQVSGHDIAGVLGIVITRALNIPIPNKEDVASFVRVKFAGTESITSIVTDAPGVDCFNPLYDSFFHVPITKDVLDQTDLDVYFELLNKNGFETSLIGSTKVTYRELTNAPGNSITDQRKLGSGDNEASLQFRVGLKGKSLPIATGALPRFSTISAGTKPSRAVLPSKSTGSSMMIGPVDKSIGRVGITIHKGWGFTKIKETQRGYVYSSTVERIPSCYCNIKFGSSTNVWRTSSIPHSLDPEWEETAEYDLVNHSQVVRVQVYDDIEDNDESSFLGRTKITVGSLLLSAGFPVDVQLVNNGKPTEYFLSLSADMIV